MNDIGKLDVTLNYLIFKMQKKVSRAQRDFNQTSALILFMPTTETPGTTRTPGRTRAGPGQIVMAHRSEAIGK